MKPLKPSPILIEPIIFNNGIIQVSCNEWYHDELTKENDSAISSPAGPDLCQTTVVINLPSYR